MNRLFVLLSVPKGRNTMILNWGKVNRLFLLIYQLHFFQIQFLFSLFTNLKLTVFFVSLCFIFRIYQLLFFINNFFFSLFIFTFSKIISSFHCFFFLLFSTLLINVFYHFNLCFPAFVCSVIIN